MAFTAVIRAGSLPIAPISPTWITCPGASPATLATINEEALTADPIVNEVSMAR